MHFTKKFALFTILSLGSSASSKGATYTYNLGTVLTPITSPGITHIVGTLTTSQIGTYSTELEIENFLNSSSFTIEAFYGATSVFTRNNGNTAWDLRFGGSSSTATVTSLPAELIIDFDTPSEISSMTLYVGDVSNGYFQLVQRNNASDIVSDKNFIGADLNANVGETSFPYDSPFRFNSVPEPSVSLCSLFATLVLLRRKRNRSQSI